MPGSAPGYTYDEELALAQIRHKCPLCHGVYLCKAVGCNGGKEVICQPCYDGGRQK